MAIEGISSSALSALGDIFESKGTADLANIKNLLAEDEAGSFKDIFSQAFLNANAENTQSNAGSLELLTGSTEDLAGVMVGATKAELALNLTVSLRNKALEAYQEITSMQI